MQSSSMEECVLVEVIGMQMTLSTLCSSTVQRVRSGASYPSYQYVVLL